MNLTLVCHVKNSFEYLPLFLAHHELLFDEIHIVDQCSDVDLRDLNVASEKAFFYKTSYSFFNAMVGTNAVIEYRQLRERSDFVFVLDIDEFLPFNQRQDFEAFLQTHQHADAIRFYWRNGMNFSVLDKRQPYLRPQDELLFFKEHSSVSKLAYNAKKTRWFLPYHGNHSAKFNFLKFVACKKKATINTSELPLYHIPFSSIENLREKVNGFDKAEFFEKIIGRHSATKRIFQHLENGDITLDDLCFFVANYRTIGREPVLSVVKDDFLPVSLWASCGERIAYWYQALMQCQSLGDTPPVPVQEKKVRYILGDTRRFGRYFFYQALCKKSFIDSDNIIQLR